MSEIIKGQNPNLIQVTGQVVDSVTNLGLADLRVEAWDKAGLLDDLLMFANTDANGRFFLSFDLRQTKLQEAPDLIFKVFSDDGTLLDDTEEPVVWNVQTQEDVTIRIGAADDRPAGKDRVTALQVLKGADFVQQSDFRGFFSEVTSKAGNAWGFLTDMVINTVTDMDLTPVTPGATRNADVVGQDEKTARANLDKQNVQVASVQDYNPKLNGGSFSELASFPVSMKAGQQVNLFVKDGVVKYYAVVKGNSTGSQAGGTTASGQTESQTGSGAAANMPAAPAMSEQLNQLRVESAKKDEQISQLQKDLEVLRSDQAAIRKMLEKK